MCAQGTDAICVAGRRIGGRSVFVKCGGTKVTGNVKPLTPCGCQRMEIFGFVFLRLLGG